MYICIYCCNMSITPQTPDVKKPKKVRLPFEYLKKLGELEKQVQEKNVLLATGQCTTGSNRQSVASSMQTGQE